MYQHGEMFSAHELFPSRLPNQCVLCSCTVRTSCLPFSPGQWTGRENQGGGTGREGDCSPWSKRMGSGTKGYQGLGSSCPALGFCALLSRLSQHQPPCTAVCHLLFSPVDFALLEGREYTQFISLSSTAPGPGPSLPRVSLMIAE